MRGFPGRKFLFSTILLFLCYGSVEVLSLLGLRVRASVQGIQDPWISDSTLSHSHAQLIRDLLGGRTRYIVHSSSLGWTIKPGGSSGPYSATAQGLRGNREFSVRPASGILRIATFGDSFTHCDQVGNDATWQAQMQRLDPGLEVLNFGVPGYGLDQAFLRYLEESRRFGFHVVLIGFMTENIFRHVNVFRPFYLPSTGFPLAKPRFVVKAGKLALLPNPMADLSDYEMLLARPGAVLPVLGRRDYFYCTRAKYGPLDFSPAARLIKIVVSRLRDRPPILTEEGYGTDSAAFAVTVGLFDRFVEVVRENGSLPVIVIFPNREDLARLRGGKPVRYTPLLRYLSRKHPTYIDLVQAFSGQTDSADLNDLGRFHYTPLANRLVAEFLVTKAHNWKE